MKKVLYLGLMTNSIGFTTAMRKHTDYRQLASNAPNFNTRACEMALEFKPDIVFIQIQTPNIINEECVKTLKSYGCFVVNWSGDVRAPIPQWYFDIGQHIDLTCFSNMHDVRQLIKDGLKSEYLEIGYDPEIYQPEGRKIPSKDIVFMGNNYGGTYFPLSDYRIQMVDFLKKTYPDNFAVYGNGWNFKFGEWNSSQPDEAAVYRSAKVAINLSHFAYERYNSDRILRIMGTGVCCLAKSYKGIEEDFTQYKDVLIWENFDSLKIMIDQALENDKMREEIALNGLNLMRDKFTYDSMIRNILKLAE